MDIERWDIERWESRKVQATYTASKSRQIQFYDLLPMLTEGLENTEGHIVLYHQLLSTHAACLVN